ESTVETVGLLIHLLHTTSDIYANLGNYTEAYANAQQARGYAETLRGAEPGNPNVLAYLYGSDWRMGDAVASRGIDSATLQEALKEYLDANALAQRLADMAPNDGARQRELMFIHQKIGDISQSQGDLEAALAEYRLSLALIQGAVQNAAGDTPGRRGW